MHSRPDADVGYKVPDPLIDELKEASDIIFDTRKAIEALRDAPKPPREAGKEPLTNWIPHNLVNRLKDMVEVGDQPWSLKELIDLRGDVDSAIKVAKSIVDVDTKNMVSLRGMLTEAIEEGTKAADDTGALHAAWRKANDFYAANRGRFDNPTVVGLFKEPFYDHETWLGQFLAGGRPAADKFAAMKEFFSVEDPAMVEHVKKAIRHDLYNRSLSTDGELIDAKALINNLKKVQRGMPGEFAKEIFGPSTKWLTFAGSAAKVADGKVPREDVERLLADPSGSLTKVVGGLRELVQRQDELQAQFANNIRKQIADRTLGEVPFDPARMVDLLEGASLRDQSEIVGQLATTNPELLTRVRRKVIQSLFFKARKNPDVRDPIRVASDPNLIPGGLSLAKAIGLGDPLKEESMRVILGNEIQRRLEMYVRRTVPLEVKGARFASAGGIGAGMETSGIMQGRILEKLPGIVKMKIASFFMTTEKFNNIYPGNMLITPQRSSAITQLLLFSHPFTKALSEEFGDEAPFVAQQIKWAIDDWFGGEVKAVDQSQQSQPQPQPQTQQTNQLQPNAQ